MNAAPAPPLPAVLLPGDDATRLLSGAAPPLRLGAGLALESASPPCVSATRAGVLSSRAPSRFWLASGMRRYTAAVGDSVVGVVVDRGPEAYRVSLRGAAAAALPRLAFDGASKRNKPSLAAGALVFARVAAAPLHGDVELTCQAASGAVRKDWTTGQTVYGELKEGTLVTVGLAHARRLLHPQCALLATFGESIPFEVAIGMNGLIWLRAATPRQMTVIANALERSESLSEEECATFARRLIAAANAVAAEGDG